MTSPPRSLRFDYATSLKRKRFGSGDLVFDANATVLKSWTGLTLARDFHTDKAHIVHQIPMCKLHFVAFTHEQCDVALEVRRRNRQAAEQTLPDFCKGRMSR